MIQDSFDVIFLSETWLTPYNFQSCCIKNYQGLHTYRSDCRSGGISIFVKNNYAANPIDELCVCNENIESCVVRISVGTFIFHAVGIYRPHSGTIESFTNELEEILCNPLINNGLVIVAGDMNVNLNLSSSSVLNYAATLNSLNYFSLINNNTRFSINDSDSIQCRSAIDHIWINECFSYESYISQTLYSSFGS